MNPVQILQHIYPAGEARAIYRMVMEMRFGLSMTDLLLGKDKDLSAENLKELELIMQRLATGEPVQYVLGKAEFHGHTFHVCPGVLIPRPETQELVDAICSEPKAHTILDIGTGSGCIALSLAKAGYTVSAIDVSDQALSTARKNAEALQCAVEFIQGDILHDALPGRQWDVIVSNPPYICRSEAAQMHCNVLAHEPHIALFVPDEDPLLFYRAIAAFGQAHLRPGGHIYLEINRRFGEDMKSLMRRNGYTDVVLKNDQFGNPRFIHCTLPQ